MEFIANSSILLLKAAVLTIEIALVAFVLGFIWGTVLVLGKISRIKVLSWICKGYITVFRGVPLLIVLFAIYFGFPRLGWMITPLQAGILGLVMNLGAFIAEVLRSGIEAIDEGQREVGLALGMTDSQLMRYIIFPQAIRVVIPALGNELINVIKDSSLVSVLTVTELTLMSQRLVASSFRALEIYTMTGIIYLGLTYLAERFTILVENKLSYYKKL